MTGQYGHFHVYAPDAIGYAKERYRKEAERLLGVLDARLEGRDFIAGDDYSIADMACYPWISPYDRAPLDLARSPTCAAGTRRSARGRRRSADAWSKRVNPDAGKPMSEAEKRLLFGQGPSRA